MPGGGFRTFVRVVGYFASQGVNAEDVPREDIGTINSPMVRRRPRSWGSVDINADSCRRLLVALTQVGLLERERDHIFR